MNSQLEIEPQATTVRALIDRMAEARTGETFLISPETKRSVTFDELRQHAIELAHRLLGLGLVKGDKVALLLDNGTFTAELTLGSMYAGCVPVPINVIAGQSHVANALENSRAKVVFVSVEYRDLVHVSAKAGRQIIVIPADPDVGPVEARTDGGDETLPEIRADDEALLIYTSGSTGQPKGALFNHRKVMAIGGKNIPAHQLSPRDRFLCVLPLYHMNAQETLIATLQSGGTVVMPRRFNVNAFWGWLADHRCTWSAIVPTIITHLLHWTDPYADGNGAGLEQLRFLRTSASSIAPSLHRAFEDKFRLLLIEVMGVTEAGGVFLYNPLPPGRRKIGSPGIPHGFDVKVVDAEGHDLPAGQTGEVVLRGPSVMMGYYKNAGMTAEVITGEGWLRTGDLAYRDEDGYFFVSGRAKEIIIKGGANVAPKEIDEALGRHPAVLEAVALGVSDAFWGEEVIAYAVLKPEVQCLERELLSFCEQQIGQFKTPRRVFFVDDLPKGPSRKIQRLQLVDDAQKRLRLELTGTDGDTATGRAQPKEPQEGFRARRRRIEERVTEVWIQVLKVDQVGVQDNFFDLGGHSLLLARVQMGLQEVLREDIPIVELFTHPTISALTDYLTRRAAGQPPRQQRDDEVEKLHSGRRRLRQRLERRPPTRAGE
jgi:acyl-CoA synthetase (AMP-forming)/AMP-acid ligase II/acyl carrier protein